MTPSPRHAARARRLRGALGRRGPAAMLVTHLPNIRWLCGFSGSAGRLLLLPRETVFLTDFRYRAQASREVRAARRIVHPGSPTEAVAAAVKKGRLRRLGFEAEHTTVAAHADLAAALPGVELVPLRGSVEGLRAVKDAGEVAAVRRSLEIARAALHRATRRLAGRSERGVADDLARAVREEGGEGEAFPSIVASGPNAALPHATPSDRVIRRGETVVVDFGVKSEGYCSDVTRTLIAGKWDEKTKMIYSIVLAAQNAAIAAIKPGVPAKEVDAAAREVIETAGYGAAFGHGTGHGVGLEVHENPSISARSGDVLQPGMLVTVEPGIYLEDFGGVRIEDMVLVTRSGNEVLSREVPKVLEP